MNHGLTREKFTLFPSSKYLCLLNHFKRSFLQDQKVLVLELEIKRVWGEVSNPLN